MMIQVQESKMSRHPTTPQAWAQAYRSRSQIKRSAVPPMSIEDAAAVLMAAMKAKYGLDDVVYAWINSTYVGAFYTDASEGGLRQWRSENDAERGFIPAPDWPTRAEFADDGSDNRNEWEHPEKSYRRGFQQGAHAVLDPLLKLGVLNEHVQWVLKSYVYITVANWRFSDRRRLKRHMIRDRAPIVPELNSKS
jgi:hypothetical protein